MPQDFYPGQPASDYLTKLNQLYASAEAPQAAEDAAASASSAATSAAAAAASVSSIGTSVSDAAASASSAASSAAAAAASVSSIGTSASDAAASASSAATSATTASTKASEAATSATTASTKASEAATSATTASTKASEAATSAAAAAASVSSIGTSASDAAASASSAATSATAASTKASEAATSAQVAAGAAQDAIDAAASISGGPVTSVNGQTGVVVLDAADFGLGSAAQLNAPATGDAAAGEVVKGNDSRLSNARTPTAHAHAIEDVTDLQTALDGKATSSHNHDGAYATPSAVTSEINTAIANLVDTAPATLNTLNELAAALGDDPNFATTMTTALAGKEPNISVGTTAQYWRGDKSWRDFFSDVRDATLTGLSTSTNAGLEATDTTLTAFGKLQAQVSAKQDTLVSSTNIKTINGQSILGAGNIEIQGGGGVGVTLSGDTNIYVTQSKTYTITNYNVFSSYVVQVSAGSVSISGDQITFTAPTAAQTVTLTVNMDSVATEFSLVVQGAGVSAPTIISPSNGATGLSQAPTFVSSALASIGLSDTFLNADHEVRTGPNGTGTLIASSYANTTSETSWTMPDSLLAVATQYYYRKLHRGVSLGAGPWSEISFTTAASFGGLIGTQGGQGFGVGVCVNGSILAARGLAEMTGTTDRAHANYGNYLHSNGSIVCYVPKFFYRIGHASSPRYATYGANAHDVVGIDTFANEAAANAAGYALHRAFVNAGVEVDGFFMDKYLASKDGTSSCKSVANAAPISLTTSTSYTNSNGMTGCAGILADAVVLARARGAGWNCAASYHYDAVALLSLAHGQASTSATYCAWYDAAGTTNFPKGCNNGSLADTNDASVTYATAGDTGTSAKPKTRATANFAKTTHNGQECGIADLNGSMWQALIGLTMAGTSATDTAQNTTGTAYVLKRSADFGALTGGFGGANDAWGTTSSLAALFDAITGFEPWTSTGWTYYGNGGNAVFSNATSGTNYQRRCNGIPILAGCSASGTNQFGNDGCYQYGVANQVPLAAGIWYDAADAGVFCRSWGNSRSNVNGTCGFRACAY